ncbi:hypothetical protein KQX54_017094 [Cotesia glomerata]|uniref:Uncharacterized protein n=1 Tax=Cotesia glomerata TaxID=32391 RepID=A0AAV7HYV9_COTGL|nr:hypothetical protein KQX54_017094 [Cotesia glomerata]
MSTMLQCYNVLRISSRVTNEKKAVKILMQPACWDKSSMCRVELILYERHGSHGACSRPGGSAQARGQGPKIPDPFYLMCLHVWMRRRSTGMTELTVTPDRSLRKAFGAPDLHPNSPFLDPTLI